jgi:c-di-GMP-binding flagellar brake protein YcgR
MGPEIIVPLAGMITGVIIVTAALKHAERKQRYRAEAMSGGGDVQRLTSIVESLSKETERLRDRVAVLEKLVTDDDRKLADEIDRLRRNESRTA